MYNEFMEHWNRDFGIVRGYIRNGEYYLAAEDIVDILEMEELAIGEISEKHKEEITFYRRNDKGVLEEKTEVTFLDTVGVDSLIESTCSDVKREFKDWIVGEVYPDMRECFARDIEECEGNLELVFELYEELASKDRKISELSKKVKYLKKFIEQYYNGDILIEDVFVKMENI